VKFPVVMSIVSGALSRSAREPTAGPDSFGSRIKTRGRDFGLRDHRSSRDVNEDWLTGGTAIGMMDISEAHAVSRIRYRRREARSIMWRSCVEQAVSLGSMR